MIPPRHDYQDVAVDFLRSTPRAGLFLKPGLGKTRSTLDALGPEHLPALVCAPKRVATKVWPVEIPKWRPDLTYVVAAGSPDRRRAALAAGADVTIIGRDVLADALGGPWKTLVIDESSGFRERSTTRWKTARTLVRDLGYVWLLTGTPAPNSLADLWAQAYLLDGGERLGKTLGGFRNRYFRPGKIINGYTVVEWIPRPEADENIHALLSDICMSMEAVEGLMPPVTYNQIDVELPAASRSIYRDMKRDLVALIDEHLGGVLSAANAAVLSGKLMQIGSGAVYDEEGGWTHLHDEKIEALREILEEGTGNVLVFYAYKHEKARLQAAFPEAQGIDDPGALERWDRGHLPMLLAHPMSAGHGLNLQAGGSTIIWATPTWSSELWEQGNGRLARQGQQHPVVVHTLVAKGTVDELAVASVAGKEAVQEAFLEHLRRT